jgi:hypothetical protein
MLRRALLLVLASLTLTLGTGCGATLVPFTHDLRDRNGLSNEDLKNLQYYISRKIVLRRELESGGKEITGAHQLVIVSGKRVEEVVIEELTPGVAVGVGPETLAVSFEPGSFLTFTPQHGDRLTAQARGDFAEGPNPFPANDGDHRELANPFPGSLGPGRYTLATDARSINYQGRSFDVVGESVEATLLIDARSLKQVSTTRQIAPGMRLR